MALFLSALGAVPLLLASFWLPWLHAPPEVEAHVARYLRVLALALPGALMFRTIYAVNTAVSRPHVVMTLQVTGLALKVCLSYVLILGGLGLPPMGAVGGAVASAIVFSALAVWAGIAIVRRFAPEASGSGIPQVEAALHQHRDLSWPRILWVKFTGGVLAIGGGLTLGREGPTVQMGGAIADGISRAMKVSPADRLTLTAAGAGAGLAAAFNAPLSGLVFVLEEVQRDFRPAVFGAAFVASRKSLGHFSRPIIRCSRT